MSVSDETLALIETRDAAYRMLSPKMATLVTNVGNSSYEHGVHYDEDNDEFERVYRRALEDEIALAKAIAELEPDLSLYGKGEPKSYEELKASRDRLFKVPLPLPFAQCNNCGRKPTLDELETSFCSKCGDMLIVYSVDAAKYIKGLLSSSLPSASEDSGK